MARPGVVAALCAIAACGDGAAPVRLARVGGPCGAAADARTLLLRALSDDGEVSRAVPAGAAVELDDLPAVTRQLTVEVLGAGGALRTVGKSAPLRFGELPRDARIPVAMAPLYGACPTAPLAEPRVRPAVARAGRYVLVLGGEGPGGPLTSAELYDPDTDAFEPVALPPRLVAAGSFLGAVATTLADGRVVLSGGPTGSYTVFDPETRQFGPPIVLEARFFHGAIALDRDRVLITGGCRGGGAGAGCAGEPARTTFVLSVDTDQQDFLATLDRDHVGPTLLLDDGAAQAVGARGASVLVIGSATAQGLPVGTADRLDLVTGAAAPPLPGTFAAAAALDSGAALTGFSTRTAAASADSSVLTPLLTVRGGGGAPALRSASLTTLEDGTVLALGQSDLDRPSAARYRPTANRWDLLPLPAELGALDGHAAVRLDDGSVLIVGAGTAASPAPTAWRFRPALTGPFTSAVISVPTDDATAEVTPSDPAAIDRSGGRFEVVGSRAGLSQWLVAGGPRLVDGRLVAVARVTDPGDGEGGLALVSHFLSPTRLVVTELIAGRPAVMQLHARGEVTELCRGAVVPAWPDAAPVTVSLEVRAGDARVLLGERALLECAVSELPRGAWGVGVLGAGARIGVDTLTVER
ncbi:MAG: hypothetical protein R3B48_05445 [Kofleriaceae bacterium]